jgi:hypothetical protein
MTNNISRLKDIAIALGDMKNDVVFIGGATVGPYINEKAALIP